MRYRDLIEAPIDQYKPVGDWENEKGSFRSSNNQDLETSHKIIHSPVAVKKIRQAWAKTPYKFNFFLLNSHMKGFQAAGGWGVWSIDEFKSKPNILPYADQLTFSDDAVNVVYTTNFTTQRNYMPLTAWMMAHRLDHIFLPKSYPHYDDAHKKLMMTIERTIKAYYPSYEIKNREHMNNFGIYGKEYNILGQFVHKVFTMRSARNKRLTTPLDLNAELMAQWLLTGSIKFNPVPEKIFEFTISTLNQNILNHLWQQLAQDLAVDYDLLFKSQVGKVICL